MMRICHITPHLPPDQAANALLPFHLGWWAREAGDECTYVAHEPRQAAGAGGAPVELAGPVVWIPWPRRSAGFARRLASLQAAVRIARSAGPQIAGADIVHIHSNGLLAEVGGWLATRRRKPFVLTLYGTEIWHYAPGRGLDLFTRGYGAAAHVTFYSHGLKDRAIELGLARAGMSVVYPPVTREFQPADAVTRAAARHTLALAEEHILLNVKRLHPLAGQKYLIQAMPEVLRRKPGTRLIICGTGPLAGELRALARSLGVDEQVTFKGLVDNRTVAQYNAAADIFVLPSLLEACPTVALEALACGTPVVSSDNPGGVELQRLFGEDLVVVPREDPRALADAVVRLLQGKRRALPATEDVVEREFRPVAVARQFRAIYETVCR
jgi:glycosyltransferase involved in cell wall biosynthesis